jgi:hypothetical protein
MGASQMLSSALAKRSLLTHTISTHMLKQGIMVTYLGPKNSSLTHDDSRIEIIRWVAESKCPFVIVNNPSFHTLMKTGCPEY